MSSLKPMKGNPFFLAELSFAADGSAFPDNF